MFVSCTNETEQIITTCTSKHTINTMKVLSKQLCWKPWDTAVSPSLWQQQWDKAKLQSSMFTSKELVIMGILCEDVAQWPQ